jgi:hypothetical protein
MNEGVNTVFHWWDDTNRWRPNYLKKTKASANLSTTNTTWIGVGLNSDLYGERPATNRLRLSAVLRRNRCSISL